MFLEQLLGPLEARRPGAEADVLAAGAADVPVAFQIRFGRSGHVGGTSGECRAEGVPSAADRVGRLGLPAGKPADGRYRVNRTPKEKPQAAMLASLAASRGERI